MKYVRLIGFVTLVPFTLGLTAAPVLAASAKPADQPFRLSVLLDEKNGLELRWSVAPATFFIATRFLQHSTERFPSQIHDRSDRRSALPLLKQDLSNGSTQHRGLDFGVSSMRPPEGRKVALFEV
jgi:hypothetical protein